MRRAFFSLALILLAVPLVAGERWIPVAGQVSVFHTDTRVLNPSFDKDIQVTAQFYLSGSSTPAGTATITVPKRQVRNLDEVTVQLFNSTNTVGSILFSSSDDFEVTSRIYAQTPSGTLGQFEPGMSSSAAKSKGALLQLKANGAPGQIGTFRSNIGALNPTSAPVSVKWVLYDKANAIISTGTTPLPAFGVIPPTEIRSGFFFDPKGADLSDAWVSYSTADNTPIFVYASCVDNGTTDSTFIAAVEDKGIAPVTGPTAKSFDVTLENFTITFSPLPSNLKPGDQVTLHIHTINNTHGFQLVSPTGEVLVPSLTLAAGESDLVRTFTVPAATGTYTYFCTHFCGSGHAGMNGSFTVGAPGPNDPGPGY